MGDTAGGGTQEADDWTWYISDPNFAGDSVAFTRAGTTNPQRFCWEIIEYIGTSGGANEMIVRNVNTITYGTGDLTKDGTSVTVSDDNDVVVFITGQNSVETASQQDVNAGESTSEWVAASNTPRFTRGFTGSDANSISYAVVEFTGSNWAVENISHTFNAVGATETETITDVGALSRAFFHAQFFQDAAEGLDDSGAKIWLSATDTVSFYINSGADDPGNSHHAVVWIIRNSDTNADTAMNVSHYLDSRAAADVSEGVANEEDEWTDTITEVSDTAQTSIMGETTESAGSGTAFPRGWISLYLNSTTGVKLYQSDDGQPQNYAFQIVQWPKSEKTSVSWNQSTIDLGIGLQDAGNLTGVVNVSAASNHTDVNVTCDSGNCTEITNNWTNGIDMIDQQSIMTTFVCSNATAGVFSAVYNLASLNDTTADQITVSCQMSSQVSLIWEQSTLGLGSVYDGMSTNSNASFDTAGSHTNVMVNELEGNGTSFMLATPTDIGSLGGGSNQEILFNCSPSYGQSPGIYQSIYNVNSTEDSEGNNITVSCTVESSYVNWNQTTLDLGNVYSGNSVNSNVDFESTGYNEQVNVTELSGTGASFTSSDTGSIGTMTDESTQQVTFTCSPPDAQSSGSYSTIYNVNTTYNSTGHNITVDCDVLTPLIEWNQTSLDISSSLNSGNATRILQITSTGTSNETSVYCTGDCATITDDWSDDTDMSDSQTGNINFNCDDAVVGSFSADFKVNSTQNSAGDTVTVNCEITQTYGWLNISLLTPEISGINNKNQYQSFWTNASIECVGTVGTICGDVYGLVRDNGTSIYGSGSDGILNVVSLNKIINNYTFINISITAGNNEIIVNDTSEFSPGDEVMIIQMQNGSGNCNAGDYEFRTISSINGNNITLEIPLEHNYCYNNPNTVSLNCTDTVSGFDSSVAQIVKVPQYTNVTVQVGASITAPAWDGYQGGIVIFRATENTTIEGVINVTGKGFRGGQSGYDDDSEGGTGEGTTGLGYNPAIADWDSTSLDWEVTDGYCMQEPNGIGAAGSWCEDDNGGDPGAGGGHGTAGQDVAQGHGQPTSEGGLVIGSVDLNRMYFGGGGGGGSDDDKNVVQADGGAGGGIVYVISSNISGTVTAIGQDGFSSQTSGSSGIGGGGAGGTIWLRAKNLTLALVNASGGAGGIDADEPGGIGGDGRIRLDFLDISGSDPDPLQGYNGTLEDMYPINYSVGNPFYSISSSPQNCGSLGDGDTCQLNISVNATGAIGSIWKLNMILFSNVSQVFLNETNDSVVNITSEGAPANQPPTIEWVQPISATNPTDDSTTSIVFNFTVTDTNGYDDINVSSVNASFLRAGEVTRINTSCVNYSQSGNDMNFSCTIDMWYYDQNGDWTINVSIKDDSEEYVENSSTNFIYNLLPGMKMSPITLGWPEINLPDTDTGSNDDPVQINNTGNSEPLNINITGYDLQGEEQSSYYIYAANFTVDDTSEGCSGTAISNATSLNITSAILYRGNHSLNYNNATSGQEQLYFCLKGVPQDNPSQSYSSSAFGAWEIRILLVALIPRRRKRKKGKVIRENLSIPVTIFTKKLGALERISKYLKENLKMSYKEIAEELNRDERTIWASYNKAMQKQEEPIKIKKTKINLPVSIFENRELTILEAAIIYLKEKGMRYNEIGKLLERNQRNIWKTYSKAIKKDN